MSEPTDQPVEALPDFAALLDELARAAGAPGARADITYPRPTLEPDGPRYVVLRTSYTQFIPMPSPGGWLPLITTVEAAKAWAAQLDLIAGQLHRFARSTGRRLVDAGGPDLR